MGDTKFENLNFGFTSKPVDYQVIQVEVNPHFMMNEWAEAYANDLERRNPLKYQTAKYQYGDKTVRLDSQVISKYMRQLLIYRVKDVNGELKGIYHVVKQLGIPAWIQFVISMVGNTNDWDRGLRYVPSLLEPKDEVSIEEMLSISHVLRSFTPDGKPFFTNAWPKSKDGDKTVMSCAIVDGFVSGNDPNAHPIKTYVAGFFGAKIRQQDDYRMLYRINYDNIQQLKAMLMTEDTILE